MFKPPKINFLFFYIIFFSSFLQLYSKDPIKLSDSAHLLKDIDVVLLAYNKSILDIIRVRKHIIEILYGMPVKGISNLKGRYRFGERSYTLGELVEIEKSIDSDERVKFFSPEMGDSEAHEMLSKSFLQAKDDLLCACMPFLEIITHDVRDIFPTIIQEWARKRGRFNNLLLLSWGDNFEENNLLLNQKLTSCSVINELCLDLDDFIQVLIHNCPHNHDLLLIED